MQQLRKPKHHREEEGGSKRGPKKKKERLWILEYQWKSLKDWNTYPSSDWFDRKTAYTEEWITAGYSRYINSQHAIDQLHKDARSRMEYYKRRLLGKNWRVRHKKTNEIIPIEL